MRTDTDLRIIAARTRLGPVTFPAGSLIMVEGSRDLTLPPGDWMAHHWVTPSPRGGEGADAIGRLSADVSASDPRWAGQRVHTISERVLTPGGALFATVAGPGWGRVSPRNGPSFVGRLGGGGSHGPARVPQGDPMAALRLCGPGALGPWAVEQVLEARQQAILHLDVTDIADPPPYWSALARHIRRSVSAQVQAVIDALASDLPITIDVSRAALVEARRSRRDAFSIPEVDEAALTIWAAGVEAPARALVRADMARWEVALRAA